MTTQSSTAPTPVAPCVGERGEQPLCPLASWDLRFQHLPKDKTLSEDPGRAGFQVPGVLTGALRELRDSLPLRAYGWKPVGRRKNPSCAHQTV